jgi:DNA-binding Lrp family transcriptional regulator
MVSLVELDRKDRAILSELDRNCRQSNAEIARNLRLGKHVVSYRIAQLEKRGVIKNYYSVIDMSRLGRQSYRIYLKLHPMKKEEYNGLLEYLAASQSTWWVGEMDGEWDVGFVVCVADHYEFEKFWDAFTSEYQESIEQSRVSIYLRSHTYSQTFLLEGNEERREYVTGAGGTAKIDGKDIKLLGVLANQARLGTLEIAKMTGLTPVQVVYRIKKLVKDGVVRGFRANIFLDDLTLYKVDFQLKSTSKRKEMLAYAMNEKWSIYTDESIGFADFELDLLCPSYQEFKEAVERFKMKFFDEVRDYRFEIYSRIVKLRYF